jgi:protein-tyrosine-phosphatase
VTSQQGGDPIRVLFVCTANICRSAYAEVLARHLLGAGSGVEVASAGTYGLPAQPLNPDIGVFLPAGADPAGFASRRVTRAVVEAADLVLAMEASHRRFLLDEYPAAFRRVFLLGQFAEVVTGREGQIGRTGPGDRRDQSASPMPEPHARDGDPGTRKEGGPQAEVPLEGHGSGHAAVPQSLRGRALLEAVARQRPPARPEHDVADPYRRGREANERAAAQIAGYLAVVLPVLRDAGSATADR